MKDKESLDIKLAQLKQENKELSENLNRATMQQDFARPELDAMTEKIAILQSEKEYFEMHFRGRLNKKNNENF